MFRALHRGSRCQTSVRRMRASVAPLVNSHRSDPMSFHVATPMRFCSSTTGGDKGGNNRPPFRMGDVDSTMLSHPYWDSDASFHGGKQRSAADPNNPYQSVASDADAGQREVDKLVSKLMFAGGEGAEVELSDAMIKRLLHSGESIVLPDGEYELVIEDDDGDDAEVGRTVPAGAPAAAYSVLGEPTRNIKYVENMSNERSLLEQDSELIGNDAKRRRPRKGK